MPDFDLAIRGGTIATAADTFPADVGIRGGRIVAIADRITGAAREIDASGLLVLPGGIDSHVHLDQPPAGGIAMADDFESGTRAAAGGNTCVLTFALQVNGESLRSCLQDYHRRAEGSCHIDHAFHLIVSDPTEQVLGQELPALVRDGYTSFKVYMTYDDLRLSDRQLLEVMAWRAASGRSSWSTPRTTTRSSSWSTGWSSPAGPRRATTPTLGRWWSSARRRTAPSASPS
jgi:dihydropyrimidinase